MPYENFKISAKNLGAVNMPDFCPRCFWIKVKSNNRLPWQSFPGIFSTIDSYTKKCIHHIIDNASDESPLPRWMLAIGDVVGYDKVPHWSKSLYTDSESNITLSGIPDDIFVVRDSGASDCG